MVALSQLSRNLESRQDKRPHAVGPARVGLARAGRRRGAVHLPRGGSTTADMPIDRGATPRSSWPSTATARRARPTSCSSSSTRASTTTGACRSRAGPSSPAVCAVVTARLTRTGAWSFHPRGWLIVRSGRLADESKEQFARRLEAFSELLSGALRPGGATAVPSTGLWCPRLDCGAPPLGGERRDPRPIPCWPGTSSPPRSHRGYCPANG